MLQPVGRVHAFDLALGRPAVDQAMVAGLENLPGFAEWRCHGYGEAFCLYEGVRTHLVTAGLGLTR